MDHPLLKIVSSPSPRRPHPRHKEAVFLRPALGPAEPQRHRQLQRRRRPERQTRATNLWTPSSPTRCAVTVCRVFPRRLLAQFFLHTSSAPTRVASRRTESTSTSSTPPPRPIAAATRSTPKPSPASCTLSGAHTKPKSKHITPNFRRRGTPRPPKPPRLPVPPWHPPLSAALLISQSKKVSSAPSPSTPPDTAATYCTTKPSLATPESAASTSNPAMDIARRHHTSNATLLALRQRF